MDKIADLIDILSNPARVTRIISEELAEIREQYGDERRSEIVTTTQDLETADFIRPRTSWSRSRTAAT